MSNEVSLRDALQAGAAVAGRGVMLKIGVIGLVVLIFGVILLGALAPGTTSGAQASTGGCLADGPPVSNVNASDEAVQLATAAADVAVQMDMPGQALLIILMTGWQESTMRNLDYGDRDSLGWLQQRPSQGWGTPEQVMDPAHASRRFYEALRGVAGWTEMEPGDAAQAVQRSGYPDAYAKWEDESRQLAEQIGADLGRAGVAYDDGTADTIPAGDGGLGCSTGPVNGDWPEEQATICPDPTNGQGCITPRTLALVNAIQGSGLDYPSLSCWDAHAWNPASDHSRGRACDVAFSSGFPNKQQKADGDAMAAWLLERAGDLGVKYMIWDGREWWSSTGEWKVYDGAGGLYDVTTPSGGHYDHIHISIH